MSRFLPNVRCLAIVGTLVCAQLSHISSAQAAVRFDYLSASLLGSAYDRIRTNISSCTTLGTYSLTCQVTIDKEPADVQFTFGANRQVTNFAVSFTQTLDQTQATSLYNRVCQQLQPQFASFTEEKSDSTVRRVFLQPHEKMAYAQFTPKNASGGQVMITFSLVPASAQ